MRRVSLHVRLLASYLAVAGSGALAMLVTTRLLAPRVYREPLAARGSGSGPLLGRGPSGRHELISAINTALVIALLVSAVASGAAALLVARRLLAPLDRVRAASRRMAEGRFDEAVALPSEPELAALAADVNRLGAELRETERRRARLVSDVAHELRTPLTTIQGFMEGLVDGVVEPTPEVFASVADEAARLRRVTADLALLSRAEEGRLELRWDDADVAALVRSTAERLRPQFTDAGVALEVHAPAAVDASVDGDRVVQVVTNLLGNALAATPPGGHVRVAVGRTDGFVEVVVEDDGRGIEPAHLERIFERFERGPGAVTGSGSGIGLTIARGIARAHGGSLTAASDGPARGARFTLRVPASRRAPSV